MSKKILLFACAAFISVFSAKAQNSSKLFLEGNYGAMLFSQNLSVFDNTFATSRHTCSELAIAYEMSDSSTLGLKLLSSGYELHENSELIGMNYLGLMARFIRPIHLNGELVIKPFLEASLGCTFLTDNFEIDAEKYRTKRYGYGFEAAIGFKVPINKFFEVGMKCGEFVSFPSSPKVDVDVPAKDYKLGEQMILAPRIMGTLAINLFGFRK